MECHSPHVTQDKSIVGITPLVPEETMAPSSELKEKGVLPRSEGDVGSTITPEVKGLVVTPESPMGTPIPLERTNGVTGEPIGLALVPCVDECLESRVQVDGDIVAPLVSLPPIADWILPKVNEIQSFVEISHGGCEDQFNELITVIEPSRTLEIKSSFKKSRELQRLFSTINYDAKGGSSTRGKSKGKVL
ncbi:uncharacterized protein LOC121257744 [Juglans microcarpa x Juglans regia]|uniref:uncharacterized protein LOC121257744 n=1 Tax=Juglans microcarpa x Juglans regia TaxID=2249226 RepID=UPI001B7F3C0C|nr:uncharacterized protein LOC121257744 [Juglans microcarpa x Juglans regia]